MQTVCFALVRTPLECEMLFRKGVNTRPRSELTGQDRSISKSGHLAEHAPNAMFAASAAVLVGTEQVLSREAAAAALGPNADRRLNCRLRLPFRQL
ncbi:hypothetical protein [Bradyrhizobium sp. MOS003]|uniref:hypothetical protein n=1 Tax=Bradyrhizobium sp. MOS003 TaxID=2133946 RepID=UPI000D44EC74|nr:hypothetical protein [Bradyrhizobium sp. MOS003]PSO13795.1 hypothetical protein C7G42_34570 [Bradyrhizobium sp. MOS003]